MKRFPEQASPFAAKVHFFDRDQIRDILRSLLVKYVRASGNNNDKVKYENDDDEDDDDDAGKGESKVESFGDQRDALTAFMALFCEYEEFESMTNAQAFLKKAKTEDDEEIINTLTNWAQDVVSGCLEGNSTLSFESSTPDELLWKLQPFTYQIGGLDGEGMVAPWPLVSVIDFGVEHPLLNEGVVFVDSPGLSDANASRAANAVKYHRTCTHKISVAEIGRAEADANLRSNLELGFRTRGSGKVILALTHGDSIDPETEVIGTPVEKRCLAKLTDELAVLRKKKNQNTQERNRAPIEDRDDMDEVIRSIVADMRKKQGEKDSLRVQMRNRKVIKNMQEIYRQLTQDPRPLVAFAVGNKVYQQYQAGFTADDKPALSVKQTEIPALRRHLYNMPVEGRLNDTLHLSETQLPSLITTFELYCSRMHLAQKHEIETMILRPKDSLPELLSRAMGKLKYDVDSKILVPMKNEEGFWVKEARDICRRWKDDKTLRHILIIKKDGVRQPTRADNRAMNWNAELLEIRRQMLEGCFAELQSGLTTWISDLSREVYALCDTTSDTIRREYSTSVKVPTLLTVLQVTTNGMSWLSGPSSSPSRKRRLSLNA